MFRNAALIFVILLSLSVFTASEPITTRNDGLAIQPEDCWVVAGEEILLELSGSIPSNTVITWDVDDGWIASVLPGTQAVLMVPAMPTAITVYATISPAGQGWEAIITRQCIVVAREDVSY